MSMRASVGVFLHLFTFDVRRLFIVAVVFKAKEDLGRPPVYCQMRHEAQGRRCTVRILSPP